MDINLTSFLQDTNSQEIVCSLDYKEMHEVLVRDSLCVPCDTLLLQWIIRWSLLQDKPREDNLVTLLQSLNLERKFIQKKTEKLFSEFQLSSKLVLRKNKLRDCATFYYLVEFKLNKSQIRNIEEFVDSGEKCNFYCFTLPDGNLNKVTALSSTASLAGTCNANYFRPFTKGSYIHYRDNKLLILGGIEDTTSKSSSTLHSKVRTDVLEYDIPGRVWTPPCKKYFLPSKQYKYTDVVSMECATKVAYVLFKGQNKDYDEIQMFLDKIDISEGIQNKHLDKS